MSLNVILAIDKNYGIGNKGKLPWYIKDELNVFREKTLDSVLIMGRKTLEKLPKLDKRTLFCVTKSINLEFNNDAVFTFTDFEDAFKQAKCLNKKIFVAGGNQLYDYIFRNYSKDIILHISFISEKYDCDTYFNSQHLKNFYIEKETKYEKFTHCIMKYNKYGERQYLDLIKDILENGERRQTRNAETISDFCKHLKFDLREGFPLLTTKKMFLKGIIEELLFFIRGDTDSKILEEKGINIWKGNTNREFLDANGFKDRKEGEMGPMYGSIWRHFNLISSEREMSVLKDSKSIKFNYISDNKDNTSYTSDKIDSIDFDVDQLKFVINEIKTNPSSRRILMTTFNPGQVKYGVLWPCHSITIQFYVQDGFLDMFCYCRSSDVFLGLPFNIASSSLFLMIIAKLTNLIPRYFNISLGDTHIYGNHQPQVLEQMKRIPYVFPKIKLTDFENLEEVENLTYKDFCLIDYKSYDSIKAEMVA